VQDRADYIILFLSTGNVIIPIVTINGVRGSFNSGKREREREREEKVCAKKPIIVSAINLPISLNLRFLSLSP